MRFPARLLVALAIVVVTLTSTGAASPASDTYLGPKSRALAVSTATDPVIAAVGDVACDPLSQAYNGGAGTSVNCHMGAIQNVIQSINPVALLGLGDMQYEDGQYGKYVGGTVNTNIADGAPCPNNALTCTVPGVYNPYFGGWKSITYPTPGGGHDVDGAGGYYQYFGTNAGPTQNQTWYSINIGSWHIISINGNCNGKVPGQQGVDACAEGSLQDQWLKQDLAASNQPCSIMFVHFPRWNAGQFSDNTDYQQLLQDFYDAGGDLLLTGHDHDYQRYAPQDPNGNLDNVRGIREFVVGTGGKNHIPSFYPLNTSKQNLVMSNIDTFGVLKLTLHQSSYDFSFLPEAGKTFTDSGSNIACHDRPPKVPQSVDATASGSDVTVTWNTSADTDSTPTAGYKIYRDDGAGAQVVGTVNDPTATSFSDHNLSPGTHTYYVTAFDTATPAGESAKSLPVHVIAGSRVTLVQQKTNKSSSNTSITVSPTVPTHAGNALVLAVALNTASSQSVTSVTDSSGGTWTKSGPIGYKAGTGGTRIELWYRTAAPAVTSVTATFSAAVGSTVSLSEWANVAATSALDKLAPTTPGGGSGSTSTASTPQLTTVNPADLVIGAVNYPGTTVTSSLNAGVFTELTPFTGNNSSGRAAYVITSNANTFQASWSLAAPVAGTGGAILALKQNAPPDTTPPEGPTLSVTPADGFDFVDGTTIYYNPSGTNAGAFTVTAATSDNDTGIASVAFPNAFTASDGGSPASPYTWTYHWSSGATASGAKQVTATNGAGLTSSAPFTLVPDTTAPTTTVTCNLASCGGAYSGSVEVEMNANDNTGGSGVGTTYYTIDGSDPKGPSGTPYITPFTLTSSATIKWYSVDEVGNAEATGSQSITVAGADSTPPTTPVLTITPNDSKDFASGSTVFYNPSTGNSGSFKVDAATSDPESGIFGVAFPNIFTASDGGNVVNSPYSKTYSWSAGATASGSQQVTATNGASLSSSSSFTLTPDTTAPTTSVVCNGGACAGSYSGSVSVALSGDDGLGNSGVKTTYYTTDGSDPRVSGTVYTGPFALTVSSTVKFYSVDNVGNAEATGSQNVTVVGGAPALIQQATKVNTASGTSLIVTPSAATRSGDALVLAVAMKTGGSNSVSSVTDSSGGTWSRAGPASYLSGTNSRIELWYRLGATSVTSVTATLSGSILAAADLTEWANVTGFDKALPTTAGNGGVATATTVSTPTLTTANASEVVIGAMNTQNVVTSTLSAGGFTSLSNFGGSSGPSGRAAYRVTTTTGAYGATWTLSGASGGSGSAILALVGSGGGSTDTSPPVMPALTLTPGDARDYVSGSTVFYNPSGTNTGSFTVAASPSDPESGIASVAFPNVFTGNDGATLTNTPYSRTYSWGSGASASSPETVTATNGASLTSNASFTVTPDTAAPSTTIACNLAACSGTYSSSVSVTLSAGDGGASGVGATYYTTDGTDPTTSGTRTLYTGTAFTVSATTTVRFYSIDNVGNAETPGSQTITFQSGDTTPPSTPVLTPTTSDNVDYVNGTTVFYNPSGTNSGGFTVTAATSDSESGITGVAFPNIFTGSDGGNVTTTPYQKSYSWSAGATASGSQQVTATNGATLTSSASFTVTPDTAAPSTTISCNGSACSGTYSSPVSVTLSPTDGNGSGVKTTYYTTDGSDPTTSATRTLYSGSAFMVNSSATVRFYSVDNVGNAEVPGSQTITMQTSDPTPPSTPVLTLSKSDNVDYVNGTTVFYNPSGTNSGSFTVTADTSDNESGIAGVAFPNVFTASDGSTDATSPYSASYSWSAGASASGSQQVTATNGAGLTASASFTVTPDTSAPTTSIACNSAACSGTYTSPVSVSLSATDGGSGAKTTYYTTDGSDPTLPGASVYSAPFTLNASATVKFFSVDQVGNAEAVGSMTVTIGAPSDSAPTTPGGLTATTVSSSEIDLSWNASSDTDATPVAGYKIFRDGGSTPIATVTSGTSYKDTTGLLPGTTHTYTVSAFDTAVPANESSQTSSVTASTYLFNDGFESGTFGSWTSSTNATVQTGLVDSGTYAARMTPTGSTASYATKTLASSATELWARERFNIQAQSSTSAYLMRVKTASGSLIGVYLASTTGVMTVRNELNSGPNTPTTVTPTKNAWHTLLVHVIVNGTASTVEVWLDGTKVLGTTNNSLGTNPIAKFEVGDSATSKTFDIAFDNAIVSKTALAP